MKKSASHPEETLDSTNRWLTLAANVGVLAGILFLAYELQQNTIATQLEAATNFQSSFSEIEMLVAGSPEFADLLLKGVQGDNVSATEQLRLNAFYTNVLRQWQFIHFQYLTDTINEEMWRGELAYLSDVIALDTGLFSHWQSNKRRYSQQFNDLMGSITSKR